MLIQVKPRSWFKRDENQPRKTYPKDKFQELVASIRAHGILQPLGARPDGMLVWGEGRYIAAGELGLDSLPVIVTDRELSETEILLLGHDENEARAPLSEPELYLVYKKLCVLNPGITKSRAGELLHKTAADITRISSVDNLIGEAKEAFLQGEFGLTTAYAISRAPLDQQAGLLHLHSSGRATRDDIQTAARKPRAKPEVKLRRLHCPVGDAVVTVAGEGLDLAGVIAALVKLLEQARRAERDGLDGDTFAKVMQGKARKQK